jgi:hypothetical protein
LVDKSVIDNFHARAEINLVTGCWIWTGGHKGNYKGKKDYGIFGNTEKTGKKYQTAHRVSWLIHYGEIPDDMMVCHKCDNPRCCNPTHLFLGTQLDNMADMVQKGRHKYPTGTQVHTNRLSENDVFSIRACLSSGESIKKISKKFNVSDTTIRYIESGKSWKWLE